MGAARVPGYSLKIGSVNSHSFGDLIKIVAASGCFAWPLALDREAKSNAASTASIAITVNSSIKVKARVFIFETSRDVGFHPGPQLSAQFVQLPLELSKRGLLRFALSAADLPTIFEKVKC
jgi:hypothetical protein